MFWTLQPFTYSLWRRAYSRNFTLQETLKLRCPIHHINSAARTKLSCATSAWYIISYRIISYKAQVKLLLAVAVGEPFLSKNVPTAKSRISQRLGSNCKKQTVVRSSNAGSMFLHVNSSCDQHIIAYPDSFQKWFIVVVIFLNSNNSHGFLEGFHFVMFLIKTLSQTLAVTFSTHEHTWLRKKFPWYLTNW